MTASRHRFRLLALAWLFALVFPAAQAQGSGITAMGWLAGCWASENGEPGSAEHWIAPAGGTMLGVGRTVKAGKTPQHEFMLIMEAPDGKLHFVALPSHRKERTTFTQLLLKESEVAFESPDHDFPQRVMYRKDGANALLAAIEGTRGGTMRRIEFPMRRIACEPPR